MKELVYNNSFFAMGTRLSLLFLSHDEDRCERVFHLIQNEVHRIENKLSYFLPLSEISRINKFAAKDFVELDEEMNFILSTCAHYKDLTFGAFDITMRGVIEKLNDEQNLSLDISNSADNPLIFEQGKLKFSKDDTKIDLGAFGKGYALERIQGIMEKSEIENAFISFGESSILTKGKHPNGSSWKVGINNLLNSGNSVYNFDLIDSSVSTSSNYYLDDTGQITKKVGVISPVTKTWFKDLCSMSVNSKSPILAEILSTAFLILDNEQIRKSINNFTGVKAVRINYRNPVEIIEFSPTQNI